MLIDRFETTCARFYLSVLSLCLVDCFCSCFRLKTASLNGERSFLDRHRAQDDTLSGSCVHTYREHSPEEGRHGGVLKIQLAFSRTKLILM